MLRIVPPRRPLCPSPGLGNRMPAVVSAHMIMKSVIRVCLPGVLALMLSACAALDRAEPEPEPDLSSLAHEAAERIMLDPPERERYNPMIAATFVDIDDLKRSTTFGRISAEIIASALAHQGMQVREVKMSDSLFIEENLGELILSRQVQRLSAEHDARSILMGTYAAGREFIYVSARLVGTEAGIVLGAADFRLPMNDHIRSLLDGPRY